MNGIRILPPEAPRWHTPAICKAPEHAPGDLHTW